MVAKIGNREGGMMEATKSVRVVLTTAASVEEAEALGCVLVGERLAACATLIPGARSIYHWEGGIERAGETLVLLKTGVDQLAALEARVKELHSYETPEFLVLGVEAGSGEYLAWLEGCLRKG